MIPILYSAEAKTFTTNGICRLGDIISCVVTEERNGRYECEFKFPNTGKYYSEIEEGRIICCTHDEVKDAQPFRIYRRSAPLNGVVTFNARHISYDLQNVIVSPMTANTCSSALALLETQHMTANPFTFWTDKTNSGNFKLIHPASIWSLLGGSEGSILDVYGGEWKFDTYVARLYAARGQDNGVTIRYGKNLLDLTQTVEADTIYNSIIPYWVGGEEGSETVVYGDVVKSANAAQKVYPWTTDTTATITYDNDPAHIIEFQTALDKVVVYDFSMYFEEEPTKDQLNAKALQFLNSNQPWLPRENIKINFAALWQTPEYAQYAVLQRVKLCDTIRIIYDGLGVDAKAKVTKVVYNSLLERYDSIEIGDIRASYSDAILGVVSGKQDELEQSQEELRRSIRNLEDYVDDQISETHSFTEEAIETATSLITGNNGGHIVTVLDANDKPNEILIMDTDDVSTAVKVMRINVNGIGFSSNGINGPYTTAWTLANASFVADFITAGTMQANRIKGGTLTLGGASNGNGTLIIKNSSGNTVTTGDNSGITTTRLTATDYIYVDGTVNSHLKIPFNNDGTEYMELSIAGFWLQTVGGKITIRTLGWSSSDPTRPNGNVGALYSTFEQNSKHWSCDLSPVNLLITHGASSGGVNSFDLYSEIDAGYFMFRSYSANQWCEYDASDGDFATSGRLIANGTKSRLVKTEEFGDRLLYCYETPSPVFGDIGEGRTEEDGLCYIWLDPVFAETIDNRQYQVFLQAYGNGVLYVKERHANYFVVEGTADLAFGWELKAKQTGYESKRMEKYDFTKPVKSQDMGGGAYEYITELEKGRIGE